LDKGYIPKNLFTAELCSFLPSAGVYIPMTVWDWWICQQLDHMEYATSIYSWQRSSSWPRPSHKKIHCWIISPL